MLTCPQCQAQNLPQMKFCGQCGSGLPAVCPGCGTAAGPDAKFCGACGTRLAGPEPAAAEDTGVPGLRSPASAAPPPPSAPAQRPAAPQLQAPEGEIKQVTVLLGELTVRSPAGAVEPELLHSRLSVALQLAQEEVQRFGGTMAQLLDRGFMAIFGAPVAHEDHPHRAALAALQMRRKLEGLAQEGPDSDEATMDIRMGLGSGTAVIGGQAGAAVGPATDQARRLMELAEPGSILAGDETAGLVRPQVELEAVQSPQQSEPGSGVWKLVGAASPFAAPVTARDSHLSPFVGRTREMAVIEDLKEHAEAGQGQVVGITGDAGSGKSRLLGEFARTVRNRPVSHLRGHCLSYTSGIPCFPFIDMIRRASRIDEDDPPTAAAAKLRKSLDIVGRRPEDHLPLFLHLLGFREGVELPEIKDPRTLQARTFAAMRQMVLAASRHSLVVLEIEDLHWIDETSEEFLASLVEEIGGARVLVILTYRSGYHPQWLQKSYSTQIVMRRLSAADSQVVVGAALRGKEIEEGVVRGIVERAEGNPFFLEELARALAEGSERGPQAPPPGTVQGVLMARLDRLPEAHKHVLQLASVLGRELSLELLAQIWDRPEPLPPLVADLQHWEFLYSTPAADQEVFAFKHALSQEVAYESLLKSRRRALHSQIAAAIESLYADRLEEAYDRLIYHYPRAGEPAKTVHYLTLFAARAADSYAHAEAAKALAEALEHAQRLPSDVRARRAVEVLLQLAESLLPLARLPETLEALQRNQEHLGGVEDPSLLARYHFWLGHTHSYLGNSDPAQEEAEESIAFAQRCGDEATEGKARYVLGRDAFWTGRATLGLEQSLRSVVLLERSNEPWWQGQAYWVVGFHHFVLGEFDQALEAFHRACAIGEALDDYRLDASWSIGYLHACHGRHLEAIEFCSRGVERARDPLNTAVAMGFLGLAYLEKNEADEALEILRDAVSRLDGTGMRHLQGWFSVFLAEAYLASGRCEEARQSGNEGLSITREASFPYGVGLALRTLGRVALETGDLKQATARLQEAQETFGALEMPFELARTRLDQARLASAGEDPDAAAAAIGEAHRRFRELAAPTLMKRTEQLAGELGISGFAADSG